MPFTKSNWTCHPSLEDGGFFPFSQQHVVRDLTLEKGSQSRPCFLHVSSEVECIIPSLHVIATVDTLDVYALVGPMDCFDYRHIARMQGSQMGVASNYGESYYFKVDTSNIPREGVWQVQLKLSATGQNLSTIHVVELGVTLERSATGNAQQQPIARSMSLSSSRSGGRSASSRASEPATNARPASMRPTTLALPSPGLSSREQAQRSRPVSVPPSGGLDRSNTLTLSNSGASSRSAAVPQQRSVANSGGGKGEQHALVASVLNAVCEKMVGVVSDKTKGYLSKASRRTERKVLEKMSRLEDRIQNFDKVLENATTGMTDIERSLSTMAVVNVAGPAVVSSS